MRSISMQYGASIAIFHDDAERGLSNLKAAESEHFEFLLHWEDRERQVRQLTIDRIAATEATLRLAQTLRDASIAVV